MSLKKFVDTLNVNNANDSSTNNANNSRPVLETSVVENTRILRKKRKSQKLLLMTVILSIFSFVTHIIVAFAFVFLVLIFFENRLIYFSIVSFSFWYFHYYLHLFFYYLCL